MRVEHKVRAGRRRAAKKARLRRVQRERARNRWETFSNAFRAGVLYLPEPWQNPHGCACSKKKHGSPKLGSGMCYFNPRPALVQRQAGRRLERLWVSEARSGYDLTEG